MFTITFTDGEVGAQLLRLLQLSARQCSVRTSYKTFEGNIDTVLREVDDHTQGFVLVDDGGAELLPIPIRDIRNVEVHSA
jgi:hypothetical protein